MHGSRPPDRSASRLIDALLWALVAAILAVIVVWSLGPAPPTGGFSLGDKVEHAAAYAALTASLQLVLVWRPGKLARRNPIRATLAVCLVALGIGVVLEVGQAFTGRDADWRDVVGDAVGVAAGALVWGLLFRPRFA